jgi:protein TonB
VAYAVSAFHERSDHMSPVAALLAAALHVATALALFWVSPLNRQDIEESAIEVTIEQPKPSEPPPIQEAAKPQPTPTPPTPPPAVEPAPPPPPPPAAAKLQPEPKPQPQPRSNEQLGLPPEAPVKPEEKPQAKPEPKPEPKPAPPQEAAAPPVERTPPPEKPLEKALPPVESPPAPLTMRDFVKVMPPPPTPAPPPAPRPPPPLQHSPLSTAPSPQPQTSPSASVSTFVNPAEEAAHTKAKDAYLWQVIRKLSQYLPDLRQKNESGTVVLRFVIARDGRLVEASIAKSSGVTALDRGMLEALRAASPYPPLPSEIPGSQVVFLQPIQTKP